MNAVRVFIVGGLFCLAVGMLLTPAVAGTGLTVPVNPVKMGSVSGIVLDMNDAPVSDAKITIWNAKTGVGAGKCITNGAGEFAHKLPAGTYNLAAEKDSAKANTSFSVYPGTTTEVKIKIGVVQMGAISGLVFDLAGAPVPGAEIVIWDMKTGQIVEKRASDPAGKFGCRLPSGTYDLYASKEFASGKVSFSVEPGKMTDLKVQIGE